MADEITPGQTPWLDDVLGPIIVDGDGNHVEPRTAGLYFVGAAYAYDPVAKVRRITITGGSGNLPAGSAVDQLLRWNGTEAVFTAMTAGMHGQQTNGLLHAIATEESPGFISGAMVAAINGIGDAIQSAVDGLTLLINQKMTAFGIGVLEATLDGGAARVPASLPSGASFFHVVTVHSEYEGLITVTGDTAGIDVSSSSALDDSTVKVLWIKL